LPEATEREGLETIIKVSWEAIIFFLLFGQSLRFWYTTDTWIIPSMLF
jgi:hypothetical protein